MWIRKKSKFGGGGGTTFKKIKNKNTFSQPVQNDPAEIEEPRSLHANRTLKHIECEVPCHDGFATPAHKKIPINQEMHTNTAERMIYYI
jgi:hypothetical protein